MEDEDNILRRALGVEEFPKNFDPTKQPMTGEEFLHHVMHETKNCKQVVTVEVDEKKCTNKGLLMNEPTGCIPAPKEMRPSLEWQESQVSNFDRFRKYVEKLRRVVPSDNKLQEYNGDMKLWRQKCFTEIPRLTDVIHLKQQALRKILGLIVKWLTEIPTGEPVPHSLGVWMYAFLSCLETPLQPEICSTLREIARNYSQIRASLILPCSEAVNRSLNLIICIIARSFNNLDLADQ